MGCGTCFVKYVMFFFNLLVALFGLALIGVGLAVQFKWIVVNVESWVFITVGAITFVIAFFACCGAICESHCMVVTYAIFMFVVIIVHVVFAVLLFVYEDNVKQSLVNSVNVLFDKGFSPDVNVMQQQFSCCGKNGPHDYGLTRTLPDSCCSTISMFGDALGGKCTIDVANLGCASTIANLYHKWNKVIASVPIGIACIGVVGSLFALCFANSIRNMDRRSFY